MDLKISLRCVTDGNGADSIQPWYDDLFPVKITSSMIAKDRKRPGEEE